VKVLSNIFVEMKQILIFSLLVLPFILISCGPDGFLTPNPSQADTLPPITTEGLQTFGYKVNGEVVRYDNQSARYINLDHQPQTGYLGVQLNTSDFTAGFRHDSILIDDQFLFDINKLDGSGPAHDALFRRRDESIRYGRVIEGGGEILRYYIDNDKPEYIISGTFWYTVVDENNSSDTAFITDGRFDLIKK
jgi:hypothetical protein